MFFLRTLAMAPPAGGGSSPPSSSSAYMLVWLAIMMAIFYVMLIRPQRRREKERLALLESIKTGDRVLFSGGIVGDVTNVKEKTLMIKIADKVKVQVMRSAVSQVLAGGEIPDDATIK